jgi:hypothetical protein
MFIFCVRSFFPYFPVKIRPSAQKFQAGDKRFLCRSLEVKKIIDKV